MSTLLMTGYELEYVVNNMEILVEVTSSEGWVAHSLDLYTSEEKCGFRYGFSGL